MEIARRTTETLDRHGRAVAFGVFLIGVVLILTRRPDALLNPQFYIEDGVYWYADAHEKGALHALILPFYRGYFVTIQRLGGMLAQAVPFGRAPLVLNLIGVAWGAAAAAFVASKRFASVLPDVRARLFAAFLLLGLPGAWTTMASTTNSQWYAALLASFVVVATPPETNSGRTSDVAVCALSGLSGPMSLFLAPVALLAWWTRRTRWSLALTGIVAATAVIQLACLLHSPKQPTGTAPLGASIPAFANLFGRRIVLETFVGDTGNAWLLAHGDPLGAAAIAVVAAVGLAFVAAVAWKGSPELRLLLLFVSLVFASGLAWPPTTNTDGTYWEVLAIPGSGNRYLIGPIFVILCALVWAAFGSSRAARIAAGIALAASIVGGVRLDWREPPLRDYDFGQYVAEYERAAPGEKVQVVEPPGWSFLITKQ